MIKQIELVAQPNGVAFAYDVVDVDLEQLSPGARLLAELVTTTDRRKPESTVQIKPSHRDGAARYLAWPARICRLGVPTESGEHYFERCARLLREGRWSVIDPRAATEVSA